MIIWIGEIENRSNPVTFSKMHYWYPWTHRLSKVKKTYHMRKLYPGSNTHTQIESTDLKLIDALLNSASVLIRFYLTCIQMTQWIGFFLGCLRTYRSISSLYSILFLNWDYGLIQFRSSIYLSHSRFLDSTVRSLIKFAI